MRAKWSDSNQSLSVDELLVMRIESLEAVVLSPTINSDLKELAESTTDKYEALREMKPLVDVNPSKIELKEPWFIMSWTSPFGDCKQMQFIFSFNGFKSSKKSFQTCNFWLHMSNEDANFL